jgi:hypothetical protein
MTEKNKGRSGGDRPTPSTSQHRNPTVIDPLSGQLSTAKSSLDSLHSLLKEMIVRVAVWGLMPASFATWVIQRGGLNDA